MTLAALASSCAYYNTFYLARRYYFKATLGAPYEVDRVASGQSPNYTKSIDFSKKVLAQYPKSKWVDDAFLLWAKALVGRDDPLQTITMLQDFSVHFPKTDQRSEATFFLGLAYRNARRYSQAVDAFDDFLKQAPKHDLVPYAHLERARALMSLGRYGDAASAAGQIVDHFPRHVLADKARRQRAEARLQDGDFDGARADFHDIGERATSDQERFAFLMREADCLESARKYDDELSLLRGELSHTPPPPPPPSGSAVAPPTGSPGSSYTQGGGSAYVPPPATGTSWVPTDNYGKLTLRIGTALLLGGKLAEALEQFGNVLKDYPRTALAAEAQYRVGYAYETNADDFDRALAEYAKVKDQFGTTLYTQQAQQRSDDLGRIMQFRKGAGADSLEKKAEAGFLTAERYLFELKRPDRALEEYAGVVATYKGTAVAARALNAQAWVLSRKLDRKAAADSLFWRVVHEYPATEAQVAARDYLEADGQIVPDSLIVLPAPPKPAPVDTTRALTPIPVRTPPLGGMHAPVQPDSLRFQGRPGGSRFLPGVAPVDTLTRGRPGAAPVGAPADTLLRGLFAPGSAPATAPTSPPPADTTRRGGSR